MRCLITWIFSFLIVSNLCFSQVQHEEIPFNQQTSSQVGIGFAITSFSANFTYFVSPHYAFRYHRHWFGITPFYGRLDAIAKQQDIGVGIDYRLYPFKNLNNTMLYFPVGVHYNYKWTNSSKKTGMLYKAGFGLEAFLGKGFSLSLDANFGIGQTLSSKIQAAETATIKKTSDLNYYFVPVFRISYALR